MAYEPLHHKYRPQIFQDLVGQEAIATTLTNAILQNKIAPAYLFSGPRGTGKTSSARILAKSLNCLNSNSPTDKPCGKCHICTEITKGASLDVIEIDAASNTGVDNIRELIERAQFAPVQCRYKVYVLDEVHMLSTAAFNSLLKTLEEPPDRVVFVLATTDPQRVLPTIISRCQRFDFRRIPLDSMANHLKNISIKENIDITEDAILTIAQIAQGGLRDAESLLDQLSLTMGQVTIEKVWDLVGAVPEKDLISLLKAIADDNGEAVLENTRRLLERGREPLIVLQNLASFYRDFLIAKTSPKRNDLVAITPPTWKELCEEATKTQWNISLILKSQQHLKNSEVQIKNTTQPRLWLEVTLLGLLPSAIKTQEVQIINNKTSQTESSNISVNANVAAVKPSSYTPAQNPSNFTSQPPISPPENPAKVNPAPSVQNSSNYSETPLNQEAIDSLNLEEIWHQVLEHIELRGTRELLKQQGKLIKIQNESVFIGLKTKSYLEMVKNNLSTIEKAFAQFFRTTIKVNLQVGYGNNSSGAKKRVTETRSYGKIKTDSEVNNIENGDRQNNIDKDNEKTSLTNQQNIVNESTSNYPVLENPTKAEIQSELNALENNEILVTSQKLANFFKGEVITINKETEWLYNAVYNWQQQKNQPKIEDYPNNNNDNNNDNEDDEDVDIPF